MTPPGLDPCAVQPPAHLFVFFRGDFLGFVCLKEVRETESNTTEAQGLRHPRVQYFREIIKIWNIDLMASIEDSSR